MTSNEARKRIFISYSRKDGTQFATALRHRLEAESFSLWQDRTDIEGGKDWWLQIERAIKHCEYMLLVMTPKALESSVMKEEWRLARQEGVCVIPVIASPDLDYSRMPRWMRDAQFVNTESPGEWQLLLHTLRSPHREPRVPFMAEDLPADFVDRPQEFEALISQLLDRTREEPIAITAALRGAGGYGKTTLARALCHHESIQEVFKHGILWVSLGEKPENPVSKLEDLIYILTGERGGFTTLEAATARFVEALGDRDILLVIDDVWRQADLKPFLQGGPRCARLITTRNSDVLPPGTKRISVDAMRHNEAVELLSRGLTLKPEDVNDAQALADLARRLGEWPLLLKLANGVLRERVLEHGQSLAKALRFVNDGLTEDGLTAFDTPDDLSERNTAVEATLRVSLNQLSASARARYGELAIFPEGADIPLKAVDKLWTDMSRYQIEKFCERLYDLSLLLRFDPVLETVRLHDVVRVYLREKECPAERRMTLHGRLLDAYGVERWADLPVGESHLWEWLAYHLRQAKRDDELVATVKDLLYLTAKTSVRGPQAAEADLEQAEACAPDDLALRLLRRHFTNAAHLLSNCQTQGEIGGTLHSRLQHLPELAEACAALARELPRPYLTAGYALPDLPPPALIRTLSGHNGPVNACAVSRDGAIIVSASDDKTLKVWDARRGMERLTLTGHSASVTGCAIAATGDVIVSASADRTLKVWNAGSSVERCTLSGHTAVVKACAIAHNGLFIVSASDDKTLKIWDTQTGAALRTLRGHRGCVNDCAISPADDFIVSTSDDGTLKVWDVQTGAERLTLTGHTASVRACAISLCGQKVISASEDKTLRIWNAHTGACLQVLTGHTSIVEGCAIGSVIVSASDDKTLKAWDVHTGEPLFTLTSHTAAVRECAINPKGEFVVSASADGTLKVWDLCAGGESVPEHMSGINGCAISPHGDVFASASSDKTVKIWDIRKHQERATLIGHNAWVRACAFSPSGDFVVSASDDKTLMTWDAHTGQGLLVLAGHSAWVRGCAVGTAYIVSASDDKTLKLWDVSTGAESGTLTGHTDWVNACAIGPSDSFVVSASQDKTLKVWDTRTHAERMTLRGHNAPVMACAVSKCGQIIVSAARSGQVKVWDAYTGSERLSFQAHRGAATGCAIDPCGRYFVTASLDRTLKVWSLDKGTLLAALHVDGPLRACAIHPDGQRIIAAGSRGVYFLRFVGIEEAIGADTYRLVQAKRSQPEKHRQSA